MPKVRIFTTILCPYCHMAKRLLREKGVAFDEVDVTFKPSLRADMSRRAGGTSSVPQIWIGDTHVGGCDDLHRLENEGALDAMLAAGA